MELKFSKAPCGGVPLYCDKTSDISFIEDGKQMKLDAEKLGIKGVVEEVDRHSRILSRQEELSGN